MNITKTYSLRLETVELIAELANMYGSQRKVIEMAIAQLAGEPPPARQIKQAKGLITTDAPAAQRESFAEQKRRARVADAVAAKKCPDCGSDLPWCDCEPMATDVKKACEAAGLGSKG